MSGPGLWSGALALLLLAACGDDPLHRMIEQRKVEVWERTELFEDGRAMQHPPAGTVSREQWVAPPEPLTGRTADGTYLTHIPLPLTPALLASGRRSFERVCANCHGLLGDGNSLVARNMGLRRPPSLHAYRHREDGYLYQVATQGFGVMPGFANELPTAERWAVVAYVRALQLSQAAPFAAAPPEVQQQLIQVEQAP